MTDMLKSLVTAVTITGDDRFEWLGRRFSVVDKGAEVTLSDPAKRTALAGLLTKRIYEDFYCCGKPRAFRQVRKRAAMAAVGIDETLQQALPSTRWEAGWQKIEQDEKTMIVARNGLRLRAPLAAVRSSHIAMADDGMVSLATPTKRPAYSPGHYLIVGTAPFDATGSIWRFYLNVTQENATQVAKYLSSALNAHGVPYHYKFLYSPDPDHRRDGGVLYLPGNVVDEAQAIIAQVLARHGAQLAPGIPALTRGLGSGLAYAESPKDGESFGFHRSRLIAEGLLKAADAGSDQASDKLDFIEQRFDAEDISLREPHRYRSSPDKPAEWAFDAPGPVPVHRPTRQAAKTPQSIADSIAAHLCETAIWDGSQCTWLTSRPEAGDLTPSADKAELGTLGPNLYAGLAGIGLFLAAYGRQTGNSQASHTGLAALRQSARLATEGDPGLYTGLTGVAFALCYGSQLLDQPPLLGNANQILATARDLPDRGFDLLSGSAGRIVGLLACAEVSRDPSLVEAATDLGEGLLASANRQALDDGLALSWSSPEQEDGTSDFVGDLLGYSHGTSGVAHAFAALYGATGLHRFKEAVEGVLNYEASRFNPDHRLWPDLRSPEGASAPERGEASICAWCNGAAGIGLSRLATAELQTGAAHRADCDIAATEIIQDLDRQRAAGWTDLSYCHGLAGSLEILQALRPSPSGSSLVSRYFRSASRTLQAVSSWPTAHGTGSPGLMTGLAGLGYSCLRWQNPHLPSLLLINPNAFSRLASN